MASVSWALTAWMCSAMMPVSSVGVAMADSSRSVPGPAGRTPSASGLRPPEHQGPCPGFFLPLGEVADWGHGALPADRRLRPGDPAEHQDAAALPPCRPAR